MENWKPIEGYEGYYEVSDLGRVRSLDRYVEYPDGSIRHHNPFNLKLNTNSLGYERIILCRDGKQKSHLVHRLVAQTFLGTRDDLDVCHNNGDSGDNRLVNLRWDTRSENILDTVRHGTNSNANKTECHRGHKLVDKNLWPADIKKGKRQCKSCGKARSRSRRTGEDVVALSNMYYERLNI